MDYRRLYEALGKLALLITGIAIGIICVVMFLNFSAYWAVIIGLLNIIVLSCGYYIVKIRMNINTKSKIDKAAAAVRNIFNPDVAPDVPDDDFGPLHKEIAHAKETIKKQSEDRAKIFNIVEAVAANVDLQGMMEDMVPKILDITKSNCGAFYLANHSINKLELKYSVGFNKNIYGEFDIAIGEGLVGDIAEKKEIRVINDIPEDTVYVAKTFIGSIIPKSLMMIPISNKDVLAGTLVLSSIYPYAQASVESAGLIQYYLGLAIGNGITLETNKRLNSELKFQNKLIQDFNDELEKKALERSLVFDNVINSIQEYAIYSMDKDGIVTTWNKGAENLMGYTPDEVIGKHCEHLYPPDEVKNGLVRRRFSIVNNEGRYHESIWRSKKGGVRYYADATLYAIKGYDGDIIGYTNVTRDISGIKNMENVIAAEGELRRELIKNDDMPLILCDSTGYIQYPNPAAVALLAIPEEELKSQIFSDLTADPKSIHAGAIQAASSRKPVNLVNIPVKGSIISINIQIVPLNENLSETGTLFAFNQYAKGECEICAWVK